MSKEHLVEKTKREIIKVIDKSKDIDYLTAVLTFAKFYPNKKEK